MFRDLKEEKDLFQVMQKYRKSGKKWSELLQMIVRALLGPNCHYIMGEETKWKL